MFTFTYSFVLHNENLNELRQNEVQSDKNFIELDLLQFAQQFARQHIFVKNTYYIAR